MELSESLLSETTTSHTCFLHISHVVSTVSEQTLGVQLVGFPHDLF